MSISSVLAQAAQHGIVIEVHGGRVVARPALALTPELRADLRGIKPDLLRLLPDLDRHPPPTGPRPPLDPSYWDALDIETAAITPVNARMPCNACRGTRWWRLDGQGTDWVCERCHPPLVSEIEVRDV